MVTRPPLRTGAGPINVAKQIFELYFFFSFSPHGPVWAVSSAGRGIGAAGFSAYSIVVEGRTGVRREVAATPNRKKIPGRPTESRIWELMELPLHCDFANSPMVRDR